MTKFWYILNGLSRLCLILKKHYMKKLSCALERVKQTVPHIEEKSFDKPLCIVEWLKQTVSHIK